MASVLMPVGYRTKDGANVINVSIPGKATVSELRKSLRIADSKLGDENYQIMSRSSDGSVRPLNDSDMVYEDSELQLIPRHFAA